MPVPGVARERRSFRQTGACRDLAHHGPFLQNSPSPSAHQRSAAHAHSSGVLELRFQQLALIEARKRSFRAQIKPVLRNRWRLLRSLRRWQRPMSQSHGLARLSARRRLSPSPRCNRALAVKPLRNLRRNWICRPHASSCHPRFDRRIPTGKPGMDLLRQWVGVGKKLLHAVCPLGAEICSRHHKRAREVTLHPRVPLLRVTHAQIRIDCKGVRSSASALRKSVGQCQRASASVGLTQACRKWCLCPPCFLPPIQ